VKKLSAVLVSLQNPKEKFWGVVLSVQASGITVRGIDLNSFDDFITQVLHPEGERVGLATLFFPMGRVERIAQGDEYVRVVVAVDDDLVLGHPQVEPHVELLALLLVAMALLDGDAAARDARVEGLELRRLLADARFQRLGARHVAERDLQGHLHVSKTKASAARSFDFSQTYRRSGV